VRKSHFTAFAQAKEILLRRPRHRRDFERPKVTRYEPPEFSKPVRPAFRSWLQMTAKVKLKPAAKVVAEQK